MMGKLLVPVTSLIDEVKGDGCVVTFCVLGPWF